MYGFPWSEFHKTRKRSTALCADMLHRVSRKSGDKGGKYGLKITYALNYNMAFTARIFA